MNKLESKDPLTEQINSIGIKTWSELTQFIKGLPYGRNKSRTDFELVLKEKKGTCSSKHALLKVVADLNKIPNVELIIGIYRINESNTPHIGNELSQNAIEFIPEAHCYLKIDGQQVDFTSKEADFENIKKDILQEIIIDAYQIGTFKIEYHKNFVKEWLLNSPSKFSFDQIWAIRERCIHNLSKSDLSL